METNEILQNALEAKAEVNTLTEEQVNNALTTIAHNLVKDTPTILAINKQDVDNARGKISDVMIDRLSLNTSRIEAMAQGILDVVKLESPQGKILEHTLRPNGLYIKKISIPLGVVAMIYESRPNVTSDASALCLKSGNVCVLRSGKEAYHTSKAIVESIRSSLKEVGINANAVNIIDDTTRDSANALMTANGYIDMLIPRGGAGLIKACVDNATVPCIQTGTGICHVYVDKYADIDKAISIINNAKTSRPSVCNAEEVLLVHESIANDLLPKLKKVLVDDRISAGLVPVELRTDKIAHSIIGGTASTEQDYDTEFLDYILSIKVVSSVEEAISHISKHSTHHSDCIVSENETSQQAFVKAVDSAVVYINASTRFTDGGEFGLGCEIGISTQRNHPRGPMGLKELNTYKYIVTGQGQIR